MYRPLIIRKMSLRAALWRSSLPLGGQNRPLGDCFGRKNTPSQWQPYFVNLLWERHKAKSLLPGSEKTLWCCFQDQKGAKPAKNLL